MLIKLCSFVEKYSSQLNGLKLKNLAKDFALLISKIDPYIGYIAWAEIYLSQDKKKDLGVQVLEDLIKDHSNRP